MSEKSENKDLCSMSGPYSGGMFLEGLKTSASMFLSVVPILLRCEEKPVGQTEHRQSRN